MSIYIDMGFVLILKILLIALLSTTSILALDSEWTPEKRDAFRLAGCIALCGQNKTCGRECRTTGGSQRPEPLRLEKEGPRFSGPANFKPSLHCKDVDVLRIKHNPGVWVVEESSSPNGFWSSDRIQVSDRMTTSFRNLSASTGYRYKAHRVTSDGVISEPEISPWFETFEMGHQPAAVSGLELVDQAVDEKNPSKVRADLVFQPGSDRSCRYEIVSWTEEEGLTIGEFNSAHDFRFSLRNLDYRTNVTVFVSSRSVGSSLTSSNASLVFVTPSCLQLHKDSAFCPPDEVRSLRVASVRENGSNYEVLVVWDPPGFPPDDYLLEFSYFDYENKEASVMTLPGNSTEVLLTLAKAEMGDRQLFVSVIAESAGGSSDQTWIYVNVEEALEKLAKGGTVVTIEKTTMVDGIIAGSSVALFAVLLGVAYLCYSHRRKTRRKEKKNRCKYSQNLDTGVKDIENAFYGIGKANGTDFENKYPLIPKDGYEIHVTRLTIKEVLGSGASGIVRLGRFRTASNQTMDVAVKMLKGDASSEDLKNFRQEISIMKSAGHHPNIVSIIGCCTLDLRRPVLVVEYCSQGDLQTYLRALWQEIMSEALERKARTKIAKQKTTMRALEVDKVDESYGKSWSVAQVAVTNKLYDFQEENGHEKKNKRKVTVGDLLKFAVQVASGMEFLSSNRIIHRDLAARNVLVCSDKTVKISDFGLSRDIYQENVYKKQGSGRLPLKWMAIEALSHQIYTTKSDVWSFGILMWEIVTLGCNPYPETPTNMILQLLKSGYRMKKPENCGDQLYAIMRSCWHSRPRLRPNFTQLKNHLERLLLSCNEDDFDLLREPTDSQSCPKLIDNHYSNIYSK